MIISMNWINSYNDLSTTEKRKVRQQIVLECQLSRSLFYEYLAGKQGRKMVISKITTIVEQARKKEPNKYRFVELNCA